MVRLFKLRKIVPGFSPSWAVRSRMDMARFVTARIISDRLLIAQEVERSKLPLIEAALFKARLQGGQQRNAQMHPKAVLLGIPMAHRTVDIQVPEDKSRTVNGMLRHHPGPFVQKSSTVFS